MQFAATVGVVANPHELNWACQSIIAAPVGRPYPTYMARKKIKVCVGSISQADVIVHAPPTINLMV